MKNKKWLIIALIFGVVVVLSIFSFRFFSKDAISPRVCAPDKPLTPGSGRTVSAERVPVTEWYDAVGTVQPSTQARIAAQVSGQVNAVNVNAGDQVVKGQVLIVLDDRQMRARLSQAEQSLQTAISRRDQARQAVQGARAAFAEAESSYHRVKNFYAAQAATEQDLEQAQSRYSQAEAALKQAEEGVAGTLSGIRVAEEMVAEAKIALGYTEITAPSEGEILKRLVDPGDMAMPGKPLLIIRTAGGLRLEAHVREGLVNEIRPGAVFPVELVTLGKTADAVVEELIPYADPRSRTFLVKAALPDIEGLYPGMYGKLKIPLKEMDLVLIPDGAVFIIGQLEMVIVKTPDGWQRRYVKTGNRYGDRLEALSGLSGGEILKLKEPGNDE
jgi:RND family efflux transporter MFP subunit